MGSHNHHFHIFFAFVSSAHLQSSLFIMRINYDSTGLHVYSAGKASNSINLAASKLQGGILPHLLPPIHPRGLHRPLEGNHWGFYYQHLPKPTHKSNTSLSARYVWVVCCKQDMYDRCCNVYADFEKLWIFHSQPVLWVTQLSHIQL